MYCIAISNGANNWKNANFYGSYWKSHQFEFDWIKSYLQSVFSGNLNTNTYHTLSHNIHSVRLHIKLNEIMPDVQCPLLTAMDNVIDIFIEFAYHFMMRHGYWNESNLYLVPFFSHSLVGKIPSHCRYGMQIKSI